jgi:hypothetical protein
MGMGIRMKRGRAFGENGRSARPKGKVLSEREAAVGEKGR